MNMAVRVRRSSQPQAVSVRTTPNAFTIASSPSARRRSTSPHLPSPIDTAQALTSHWEGDQGRWEHKRGAGR
jgi:hypothetical protein